MKILMFGRGVIGTVYGWALEQAGHEIEFYVRSGRAAIYGDAINLDVLDARRRIRGQRVLRKWPVRYVEALKCDHNYDLIVLSVPHYRLTEAANFLAPRVGKSTVLVFGNIWSEPLTAIGALSVDRVAWGFPGASGSFDANDALCGMLLRSLVLGTLGQAPNERERSVRKLFLDAGFRFREQPDFRGWVWLHFVMDAGLYSQALRVGSLAKLAGSARDLGEALRATRELLPIVAARGVDLRQHQRSIRHLRAPAWLVAGALAWASRHFPPARRAFQAHSHPQAQEPRAVCLEIWLEAERLGIAVPRLEAAKEFFLRCG